MMGASANILLQTQTAAAAAVKKDVLPVLEAGSTNKHSLQQIIVQPKLTVGAPDDPYEKEADAVADKVMRMPENTFIQRKCADCEKEEKINRKPFASFVQKKSTETGNEIGDDVAGRLSATKGGGNSMNASTRSFMESRFGNDFSDVRIHTGSDAVQLSQQLNAHAFTTGSDIYFNSGKYAPNAEAGKHLLAHELTHVVQQVGEKTPEVQLDSYCPNETVNDATVQNHINSALAFATTSGRIDLNLAFSRLRTQRENNCCDANLAAAEHYMYARSEVASGSWSFYLIMLTIAYDFAKFIHVVPRTGDCPVTRASWAQIRWASQGAVDGDMDYYSRTP